MIPVGILGSVLYRFEEGFFADTLPLQPRTGSLREKIRRRMELYRLAAKRVMLPRPGDLLLSPSQFPYAKHSLLAELTFQYGCRIITFVHDLIPIRYPQFNAPGAQASFERWLQGTMRITESYVCVSRTTQEDLQEYMRSLEISPSRYRFLPLHLGCDITPDQTEGGLIRKSVQEIFHGRNSVYLTVSTIEPRKNHALILDAFEELWKKGSDATLLIIGRIGWEVEDLVDKILRHPEYGHRFTMLNDVNDTELLYCYRRSKAMIFASFTEGFGLPIVEALASGLPVLASDTSIHREVAGEHALYFDPHLPKELAAILERIERGSLDPADRLPGRPILPTWEESTRSLLERLSALLCEQRESR